MSDVFRSSDEFDEQAHQLYNQGRYEEALEVLRDGLLLYPTSAELHVGQGYAHLAREDFAWARRSFMGALSLEPDHEEGLAGLGEVLLRVGDREGALRAFERLQTLGFQEDHDLMLQVGRALFRESLLVPAYRYFELAAAAEPECEEAAACMGYASHRLGNDGAAIYWLRRALAINPTFVEPRIYLANLLYDRGDTEAALTHFERTLPGDHFDELGLFRTIELKRTFFQLQEGDPVLDPWYKRIGDLVGDADPIDDLFSEIEAIQSDGTIKDRHQLELFGTMQTELPQMQRRVGQRPDVHQVVTLAGQVLKGTWEEIVAQLKAQDRHSNNQSLDEFMKGQAIRGKYETGVEIPVTDAESFVVGAARAGVLRIVH